MKMSDTMGSSFKASRAGSFFIAVGAIVFAVAGLVLWYQPDAPADLKFVMGLIALGAVLVFFVALYRLIVQPVMVRVSEDGLYIKNYDATLPWDALEKVVLRQIEARGEIIEFVPKQPLHPVLTSGKFAFGQKANKLAGLPDYCYSMTGVRGNNQDLLSAISIYLPTSSH